MLTTVIVPTWNRAPMLAQAIASLLRQRHEVALDILVVDDGSTDETASVIASFTAQTDAVRMVRQENGGVSAARNAGLTHLLAQTEIVTFLDSDDTSPRGRFAADLPLFRADPALDVTYGVMQRVTAIDPLTLAPPEGAVLQPSFGPQLSLALMRRRVIEKTGRFDLELRQSEDTDYLFRVFEGGARFVQNSTVALYYRVHPDSLTADRAEMRTQFLRAVTKSLRRRRADPGLCRERPTFDLQTFAGPEQSDART